jgi:hypothetical protein
MSAFYSAVLSNFVLFKYQAIILRADVKTLIYLSNC